MKTHEEQLGVVTIVCQKFMVQYVLMPADPQRATKSRFISSAEGQGLLLPEITISAAEMKAISRKLMQQEAEKTIQQVRRKGLKMLLNNIYIHGDYYFVDLSIKNNTHIPVEIDHISFHVHDKKVLKATHQQSIEIEPEYILYTQKRIQKHYRNVYVFKKFTFPSEKTFEIRLIEKQLSGRTVQMQIDYRKFRHTEPI